MVLKEQFLEILKEGKVMEIIPFLKSLTPDERKSLVPLIKSKNKECMQVDPKHTHGTFMGSHSNFNILSIASFVCFDYNEYKKNPLPVSYMTSGFIKYHEYSQQELMKKLKVDDILEWYHPQWMSEYLNNSRTNIDYEAADYDELMRWQKKGYITLSPELIVATLQRIIFKHVYHRKGGGSYHLFEPERLFEYPETLREHIWFFFEYPSNIYFDMYWGLPNKDDGWAKVFKLLVQDGKLDRIRVLNECLSTANRNFNKSQIGWFTDLFNELSPSKDELLHIQPELFTSLTSPQTKPVNNALNHIKTICTEKEFQTENFITYLPVLSASSAKNMIKTTIDISDKILKERSVYGFDISNALASIVCKDEAIQKKLIKLISQYGNPEDLSIANQDIPGSLNTQTDIPETISFELLPHIHESNSLQKPETFDDFLFFATQAFANNEPWHCFMFVECLLQFHKDITEDNVAQLEPVFKSAVKVINQWSSQIGLLDRTFAAFFISYGRHLIRKFPQSSDYLTQLIDEKNSLELANWPERIGRTELYPYYHILLKVLDSIKAGSHFQLLSTPTHSPLWIAPEVLVKRLINCQQNGFIPYETDFQLALQRCCLEDTSEALSLADNALKGEIHDQMLSFLTKENQTRELDQTPKEKSKPMWSGDYKRLICSSPYNHDTTVEELLSRILTYPTMGSSEKDMSFAALSSLFELRIPFSETDYQLLAVSLLAPDKSVRDYAAELWIHFSVWGLLDSYTLGQTIGELEQDGRFPLKRFTELIENNIIHISRRHNQALEQLITSILSSLRKPITNLKRLLEIYRDLLISNQSKVDSKTIESLKQWENQGSLKNIVKQLLSI